MRLWLDAHDPQGIPLERQRRPKHKPVELKNNEPRHGEPKHHRIEKIWRRPHRWDS